ncbi:MAG: 2-C-methyl-D-erythritol 2,4-cyclodiphosphate synthase [Anaeroplasmataceae bacterium]
MIRIGHSWDVHKLVSGRKLILGGIHIVSELGLLGHSDADVVLHAISESLLGSIAENDLGYHFPDSDNKFKDISSIDILEYCYGLVLKKGYVLSNLDVTIYSEDIKISPHRKAIQDNISKLLKTETSNVNIKATTYEKLGFIGNNEAIASECVCLVIKKDKKTIN